MANRFQHAILLDHSKNLFGSVIPTQVDPIERRFLVGPIHEAARDRIAVLASVSEHRRSERSSLHSILIRERLKPFVDVPAIIVTTMDDIHFLHPVLPDIGQPEIAGEWIKAEPPGVPEAIGPD